MDTVDRYEYGRNKRLEKLYGITQSVYDAMYDAQDGRCAICQTDDATLVVDHCHHTGVVRGLLCSNCNRALGLFQDDPDVLEFALAYLEQVVYD